MKKTLRISFDLINLWDRDEFRLFIGLIQKNLDHRFIFDLFMISELEDPFTSAYFLKIQDQLGLKDERVFQAVSLTDKIDILDDNGIDIHFDGFENKIEQIEEDIINITPILVTQKRNRDGKMKYIEEFEEELNRIENES